MSQACCGRTPILTLSITPIFIRPEKENWVTPDKAPDTIVRGAHPSKIAKGGAASFVVMREKQFKPRVGQPPIFSLHPSTEAAPF